MKLVKTRDAVGHVLCHDITRIVKGVTKGAAFRKGHVITEEDIDKLLDLGKENLYVWEMQSGMLHENEAADILYKICAGECAENMHPSETVEGKVEVISDMDGLLEVDIERLRWINTLGQMMIATRHNLTPVSKGDKLAGARIIPLIIEEEKMKRAVEIGGRMPIVRVHAFRQMKVGVITTGSEVFHGRIEDTFTPVLAEKLAEYGAEIAWHVTLPDAHEQITESIDQMIADGAEMVLCTGGMSVDPDDRTPLAIKNTGARIVSYGAPVLPGAMFLLAYKDEVPVVGLPGCVMYARRTIFDVILPRLLAGVRVGASELAALGHGGLCMNCAECTFPNCGFGKGV